MKKVMMIATIVAALAFFVSVIAVTPSGAAETTKTQTKQKPQKKETLSDSSAATKPHKPTFWDLEVWYCWINNGSNYVNICGLTCDLKRVKLDGHCAYKAKTPAINNITKEDAEFWGKGKPFTTCTSLASPGNNYILKREYVVMTPNFTWGDVLAWKKSGLGNTSKVWKLGLQFIFEEDLAPFADKNNSFLFQLDKNNDVKEYMERNNTCSGKFNLFLPFPAPENNIIYK